MKENNINNNFIADKYSTVTENVYKRNAKNMNVRAFEGFGNAIDYKTYFDAIDIYAKAYKEIGVKDGDIVTLCTAGTLDTIINFYALNKIGAVALFVNPNYFKVNSKKYINDCGSKFLFIMDKFYPMLKESISETNVEKIIVSPISYYSSFIYKMLIKETKLTESDKINNVEYLTLKDFTNIGEKSKADISYPKIYIPKKPAAIVFTSGSTGNPKGVVLSNDSFNNMISIYAEEDGFGAKVGNRNLILIPPMYGTSLCHCVNTPVAFGITNVLQPIYNPKTFAKDIYKTKPNIVMASKAHFISLLDSKLKKDSADFVKLAFCGGEPITAKLSQNINEKLNYLGIPNLIICYGMSELGTLSIFNYDIKNRTNESGHLLPNVEAKIVDDSFEKEVGKDEEGNLLISTPCVMNEYLNDEEDTKKFFYIDRNGKEWAKTNDIAKLKSNGIYDVVGRKSDSFIDENGNTIYLFDIENLIEENDKIRECEVVDLTINGKKVPVAHLIFKNMKKDNSKNLLDLDKECKDKLKNTAVPYAYKIRESFSTSPISGKRDYETLKYETEGFEKVNNGIIEDISLDSEESKKDSEIEKVKKLKLNI